MQVLPKACCENCSAASVKADQLAFQLRLQRCRAQYPGECFKSDPTNLLTES
jgi:hypothetical protein